MLWNIAVEANQELREQTKDYYYYEHLAKSNRQREIRENRKGESQ